MFEQSIITGPPNGPVLFCWLSSSSVTLPVCGPVGRWACGWSACWRPGAWVVGQPTLQGGPVRWHPVRATPLLDISCMKGTSCVQFKTMVLSSSVTKVRGHQWLSRCPWFICLLLRAGVQPTLDSSAETLCFVGPVSLPREKRGIGRCVWCVCMTCRVKEGSAHNWMTDYENPIHVIKIKAL